tara:strand:- start:1120 stop:1800 length:681 start_codon:yes stop_codon:yes gene_type:complete
MSHKIITYGNLGYIEYIKNFYANLKSLDIHSLLTIYCLDDMCYKQVKSFAVGSQVIRWETQSNTPVLLLPNWREAGYEALMYEKLRIVHRELSLGNDILYSDSDVFLFSNPLTRLMKCKKDCSFMLDWDGDACAGFFYAKSSSLSKMIFSPSPVADLRAYDQTLINNRLQQKDVDYNMLDASLFCNGPIWRGALCQWGGERIAVHYNAIGADIKIEDMKKYGHWII